MTTAALARIVDHLDRALLELKLLALHQPAVTVRRARDEVIAEARKRRGLNLEMHESAEWR